MKKAVTKRNRRALSVGVGLSLMAFGAPLAGTASAAHIACGTTITASTTLDNDIGPCPGNGIIIGADNITLNLNGHQVIGNSDEGASGEFAGIRLPNRRGVTVIGNLRGGVRGVVAGFEAGVLINAGGGNTIGNLRIEDNLGVPSGEPELGDGIIAFNSAGNSFRQNYLSGNGYYDGIGVLGVGSNDNIVQNNVVESTISNGAFTTSGIGIILNPVIEGPIPGGASIFNNRVTNNVVRNNDAQGISTSSSIGTRITGNLVENNALVVTRPGSGIGVRANLGGAQNDTKVLVEGNTVRGNGVGVDISSNENRVLNNEIIGNSNFGVFVRQAAGITVTNNTFTGNRINSNGAGGFISLGQGRDTISDNEVNDNGGTGIQLFNIPVSSAGNSQVLRNQVHGNAARGIFVASRNNLIRDNNAADNNSFDLIDGNPECDNNVWLNNIWGSGGYSPECVTTGGSGPNPPAAASSAATPESASTSEADLLQADDVEPPARRVPIN